MFMMPSAYLWVYVRPGIPGSYMDPLFDQFDVYVSKVTKEVLTLRYWKEFERKSSSQIWKAYSTSLLSTTGVALAKTVWALLVVLFSLLFFSTTYVQPISSFMFISWDIHDIVTVKIANLKTVVDNLETGVPPKASQNPEMDWGFGQILPIVLLLLWIIAFIDALSSMTRSVLRSINSVLIWHG